MQPNQQLAQQSQSPEALPYQVPDYLHLDPTAGQQQTTNRSSKKILITITLLIVVVAAATTFILRTHLNPEDRFFDSLSKSASTSYVSRTLTITSDNSKIKTEAEANSDLTDPLSPKSKIDYTYTQPSIDSTALDKQLNLAGKLITTSSSQSYGMITAAPSDAFSKETTLKQWYPFTGSGSSTLDPLDLTKYFNAILNIVPIGNFSSDLRQLVVDTAKKNNVYKLKNINENKKSGQDTTSYEVEIDKDKLANLGAVIMGNYGKQYAVPPMTAGMINPISITIDNSSNRIRQIGYKLQLSDKNEARATVDFTYKENISINAPTIN